MSLILQYSPKPSAPTGDQTPLNSTLVPGMSSLALAPAQSSATAPIAPDTVKFSMRSYVEIKELIGPAL